VDALIAARAARGKRPQTRKPSMPRSMSDTSMYARMRSHLRKLARLALNDRAKAGHDAPPVDDLAEALAAYVGQECRRVVLDVAPGDPRPSSREQHARLTPTALERLTLDAARYVLDRWTPDYTHEQQRRGGVGGSRSRRGPTKATAANADKLAALPPGLTVAQQAEHVGVSERTIKRMRRAQRADS
jgi:hypothetical protein